MLGGSLDARDTEFTGHHESLAVLTTPNARSPGDGKAPSMLGGEDSSMVKLWGCTLTGAGPGTIGTVCSVIGARSSLSAMQCVIRGAAVGAVVSRGAWLVIEDCTISDSHVAGVWCSGRATWCWVLGWPSVDSDFLPELSLHLLCVQGDIHKQRSACFTRTHSQQCASSGKAAWSCGAAHSKRQSSCLTVHRQPLGCP